MGDVVNLRRARKAKARAVSEAQAAANRIEHGRTKAEKAAARVDKERQHRSLDGAKLESD
jgi:hypothetical protein